MSSKIIDWDILIIRLEKYIVHILIDWAEEEEEEARS